VNFGLPNLQGRVPIHTGQGHNLGEVGGEQNHTLSKGELPTHFHSLVGSTKSDKTVPNPNTTDPSNAFFANTQALIYNQPAGNLTSLGPTTVGTTGGSQAHLNMQPFLTLSFCIALQGIFPSQT